jgi:TP901-1 family phage major tail protein
MSAIKGLDVLIKVGTQVVGGQRNASIELSSEPIDTTTKQAGGWTTKVAGIKSWTSSCDGVYFVDDAGIKAVYAAFEGGNEVELEFSNTSGIYHKGKAIITSISEEAGQDDVVSYTMAFEGTGALTNSK